MITFEESLYISDGDYRYDNRLRDTMPGDIFYAETLNEDDYRVVDWHEVVWLNVELAEMARLIAEAEVHQEKSVPELLDGAGSPIWEMEEACAPGPVSYVLT